MQLARLTKRQTRDMVTALGGPELAAATRDALVARADGVPLYIEELTKAVAERGAARSVEAIPATLADSLMARLDRLSAAKEVAQRAAVLGREFGYPLLAATAGLDEAALRHGLARLVDAEILRARGAARGHVHLQARVDPGDGVPVAVLKRIRQQLHAGVVRALLEQFRERAEAEPEVVARHAEAARLTEEAVTYYQRAGEEAQQRSAHEEAIGHFRKAIGLLGPLPEGVQRDKSEIATQLSLATSLTAVRGYAHPEAEAAFLRAHVLVEHLGDAGQLFLPLQGLAVCYYNRGEFDRSIGLADRVLAIAEQTCDPTQLILADGLMTDVPSTASWRTSRLASACLRFSSCVNAMLLALTSMPMTWARGQRSA